MDLEDLEVPVAAEMKRGFARAKMMRMTYRLARSVNHSAFTVVCGGSSWCCCSTIPWTKEATYTSLILDALSLFTFSPTDSYFLRDFPEDLWPVGFLRFS